MKSGSIGPFGAGNGRNLTFTLSSSSGAYRLLGNSWSIATTSSPGFHWMPFRNQDRAVPAFGQNPISAASAPIRRPIFARRRSRRSNQLMKLSDADSPTSAKCRFIAATAVEGTGPNAAEFR